MENILKRIEEEFGSLQEAKIEVINNNSRVLAFLSKIPKIKDKFFIKVDSNLIFLKDNFLEFLNIHLLNKSYTKYSNKIGLSDSSFLRNQTNVVLNFAFKDCILKGAQSKDEEKSKEIFFNEILASDEIDRLYEPKVLCNFELYNFATKDSNLDSAPPPPNKINLKVT
ncbi:site-specific DNA-methyltransferase [Helicobacter sp. MIT 14-3879]|uniref:site-specific DNA-methyltransferase n=1 Tax=Helicobacter sp. MIT 14-3879 TaxID=2040649 RepID=UPI0015F18A1B|nr:site-specific DNA-methyltransferase [Helicobacter sp. MIT 14-3879]